MMQRMLLIDINWLELSGKDARQNLVLNRCGVDRDFPTSIVEINCII